MFVLDTDHASLYQQAHPTLGERLRTLPEPQLAITVVSTKYALVFEAGKGCVIISSD